jgi:tRNA-dihydrouridine synthase
MKQQTKTNNLYAGLPRPFFVLAPMDDVTDTVFRQLIATTAPPDLYFTEFVNVDALQSAGRENTKRRLRFTPAETPLILQIWGQHPENFYKTAKEAADGSLAKELGLPDGVNFAGIDLNMGCPAKSEVKNGTCSALIKTENREHAKAIIDATKKGSGSLPLSVKTRLGFNEVDWSWTEFLLEQKLNVLTMHGRTKKQMSKVPADWDAIGKVRELRDKIAPSTLIVGNGDVLTHQQGQELSKKYKLDGVMIARGVFQDPYVFHPNSPWPTFTPEQKKELYTKHVKLFEEAYGADSRRIAVLNKFCKIYINGFDGAKELRDKLMHVGTTSELLDLLK